ncbi:Fur family transcriptional regulator [Candidatus Poriferisodalis sp.]|uniref:Fur family transcriptional regulator n=1 Tax=Candidatus Poriferisodalis sp. TaxID=3101277 RepID=UPI003B02DAF8
MASATNESGPTNADTVGLDVVHAEATARLQEAGQRYTSGRRRLVEVLAAAARPVRLPDIEALAPDLARSSAYRNLEALERCGVVERLNAGGDHAYFELAESLIGHHHHLICEDCSEIADIELDSALEHRLAGTLAAIADVAGYVPSHHSVDLYGRCSRCVAAG